MDTVRVEKYTFQQLLQQLLSLCFMLWITSIDFLILFKFKS